MCEGYVARAHARIGTSVDLAYRDIYVRPASFRGVYDASDIRIATALPDTRQPLATLATLAPADTRGRAYNTFRVAPRPLPSWFARAARRAPERANYRESIIDVITTTAKPRTRAKCETTRADYARRDRDEGTAINLNPDTIDVSVAKPVGVSIASLVSRTRLYLP